MDSKFSLAVFVFKDEDTFFEYVNLEELLKDQGEKIKDQLLGYFPIGSNVTYTELDNITEEIAWTVAYFDDNDAMLIKRYNNTTSLKRDIPHITKDTEKRQYIAFYMSKDFIPYKTGKRLDMETWKNIIRNTQESGEEIEITWLDAVPFDKNGNPTGEVNEWVLNCDCELFEDGFMTEKEAQDRLDYVKKTISDMMKNGFLVTNNAYDCIVLDNGSIFELDSDTFAEYLDEENVDIDNWNGHNQWDNSEGTIEEVAQSIGDIIAYYENDKLVIVNEELLNNRKEYYFTGLM